MKKILILLFVCSYLHGFSQSWDTVGNRMTFVTYPIINVLYATDTLLYAFGSYTKIGEDSVNRLAKWNGNKWSNLGNQPFSVEYGYISTICSYKKKVVVAGPFQSVNNILGSNKIALWDYQNWQLFPVPFINTSPASEITSSTIFNDDLFVAGNFPENNRIARFDGTSWLDVGGGVINDVTRINCMAVYNSNLYVGGMFGQAGSTPAFNIARWDGSQWHDLDTGLSGQVRSIVADTINNYIYACGYIGYAGGGVYLKNIAKWDGQQWYNVGYNELTDNNGIDALALYRGKLYCGGGIFVVGNDTLGYMARWSGITWESLGFVNKPVLCMTVFQDELYVGGYFTKAGTDSTFGIARYYEPPDSACLYFNPVILTSSDTFYLSNGTVPVHFYNNNNRADSWHWNFGNSGIDTVWHPTHNYTAPGNYIISVTVTEAHCTKTVYKSVVVVDTATGINQQPTANSQQPAALKIYPNPATGSITIEVTSGLSPSGARGSEGSNNSELRIANQHGKIIKTFQLKEPNSKIEINTKGWAKGTYLCSLIIKGKTVKVEKLVIE